MANKTNLAIQLLPLWLFLAAAMCGATLIDYVVNAQINVAVLVLGLIFMALAIVGLLKARAA